MASLLSRPGIGAVIEDAKYMDYGIGLIPYAAPGVLLFFASLISSIIWCCCACKPKRLTTVEAELQTQKKTLWLRAVVYDMLLLSAVIASIVFVMQTVHGLTGVITDAERVVDAVLDRVDSVNSTITGIKAQGLRLAPDLETYLATDGVLLGMQPAFDTELADLGQTRSQYPEVQGQIDGILSTAQNIQALLRVNNTDIVGQIDNVLRQIRDARASLVDKREQPIIHDISYYTNTFAMPVMITLFVLLYVLASMTGMSVKNRGLIWSMGQWTTPFLLFMCVFAMVVIPVGRVLEDGCQYVHDQEAIRVNPYSNSSLERTAYACLYNQSLLTVADVNISKILDIDGWVHFPPPVPVFNITTAGVNATLEALRFNVTQSAMALVLNVKVVLNPLLLSVRQGAENAVCDTIGGRVFDLRDRLCSLPSLLTYLAVSMAAVVFAILVAVSLRACRKQTTYTPIDAATKGINENERDNAPLLL